MAAPTDETLRAVLHNIITRTKKLLTRRGVLVEEQRQRYVADNDSDSNEACTYRTAFGPRAGHKVLTVPGTTPR